MIIYPTQKLLMENSNIKMDLFKQQYITRMKYIMPSSATAPRLYELSKIHKPMYASSVEVPCYYLAKHVDGILKNIISKEYNIKKGHFKRVLNRHTSSKIAVCKREIFLTFCLIIIWIFVFLYFVHVKFKFEFLIWECKTKQSERKILTS